MIFTSWSRHSGFSFVFVLVLVNLFHIVQSEDACPEGCKCGPRTVDCLHGKLKTIPTQLPASVEIQRLNFARNKIQHVLHELDAYPGLQFLSLATNNISTLDGGAFEQLVTLDTLLLSRNFISNADKYTFRNLTSLRHLDVSYNTLRILRNGTFADLGNLKYLDLKRNDLSVIELEAFRGLAGLEVLNLTRNKLDVVPVKAFEVLGSLKMLILDDNLIKILPAFAFSKLVHLEYLSITGNRLQLLDQKCFLTSLGGSVPLRTLYLRGAHLDSLPEGVFRGMNSLEVLDLSQTKINKLSNNSLGGLSSLRRFKMESSEKLSKIGRDVFAKMTSLTEVVIRENPFLADINNISFINSRTLQVLDLSKNSILTFSKVLVDWNQDVVVNVRGNKFQCDCKLSWLPSVLSDIRNNETKTYLNDLVCDSPFELKGQQITSVTRSDFRCTAQKEKLEHDVISRAKVGAISAAVLCVIIIVFVLLLKYKKSLCLFVRRQYRYSAYKNKNGIFTVNADNDEITTPDDETPMDDMLVYTDDATSGPDAILVTNNNRK